MYLHILAPTVRDGVAHSLKKETLFSSTAKQNVHKIGVIIFTEIYKEIIEMAIVNCSSGQVMNAKKIFLRIRYYVCVAMENRSMNYANKHFNLSKLIPYF